MRKAIVAGIVAATFAAGIGTGAAVAGSSRVRFSSNDGRTIIVRDPRGGFLRAEDSARLVLVDYRGNGTAIYRVANP